MKRSRLLALILLMMLFLSTPVLAGQVTLAWDANDPAPEGYYIYHRTGPNYDYTKPLWQGQDTGATVELPEGQTYWFVVRAYDGVLESANSEEINYTMPTEGIPTVKGGRIEKVVIININ